MQRQRSERQNQVHNVNVNAVEQAARQAQDDPSKARQPVTLSGDFQTAEGDAQFRATIPYPGGEVDFSCDFPPPLGGTGAAPNPLVYCLWGGIACYAMTFALEAAREGVELRALRGTITTEVDLSRALGVSDRPPVEQITWQLDVDTDASPKVLEGLRDLADERCPGVYCMRNEIPLVTAVSDGST